MIIAIRLNNYLVYASETELSLRANMKIKRFASNAAACGNFHALKAVGVYGANNVGKTCLVRAVRSIVNVLRSRNAEIVPNLFSGNRICRLGVTFSDENRVYSYDFGFDPERESAEYGFIYEKFSELKIDKYGNESEKLIFLKDVANRVYRFEGSPELEELMKSVSPNNILIYTINTERYPELGKIRNILLNFAKSVEVVDLGNIPLEKTIELLKDGAADKSKVVELIKKADLDVEDYEYVKPESVEMAPENDSKPPEIVLQAKNFLNDMLCLTSVHKGKRVPSMFFDSTGTKKVAALASYIVEALEEGKTLVVDELDSSLHFKLTRAIVALFNNELNKKGQIIFTLHDITLLDCKKLFRKDQIWFADKDENGAYLYSLNDFTSETGFRAESDLFEQYKQGKFGAIPEPDLISVLLGGD